jgi:hypothetical protein
MLLNGDRSALKAYFSGDRDSRLVRDYFERAAEPAGDAAAADHR